jgi:TIR domain-containing protein
VSGRGIDFFISHAGRDTGWAEWLAWQLKEAGYSVELNVWDWAPGEDFMARMGVALERADRLLAVCTEAYFSSVFGGAELRAAFSQQTVGRVVPVLVEPVTLPALYAPLVYVDLTGLGEAEAAARLRARLSGSRPTSPPLFPRGHVSRRTSRGSPAAYRECGGCRRATRASPVGTACSPSCGDGCALARARW